MQMKNGHQFLKDIIKETFRIPKYQRGYRWTEENVTKLLEDIYEDRFFISNTTEINTDNASNIFNGITFEGQSTNNNGTINTTLTQPSGLKF